MLRDTSADFRESGDGLPRSRKVQGKTDAWKDVYDVLIPLPSSYHHTMLEQPCMRQVLELEYDFRRATASGALGDVRAAIINREVIKIKRQDSQSKKVTERYDRRARAANADVVNHVDHYRRHWIALEALGRVLDKSDPQLRRLNDADVVKIDMSTANNLLGQSKQAASWIWGDFSFVESVQDSRYQEFYDDGRPRSLGVLAVLPLMIPSSPCPLVSLKRRQHALERRGSTPSGGDAPHLVFPCIPPRSMGGVCPEEGRISGVRCRRIRPQVRSCLPAQILLLTLYLHQAGIPVRAPSSCMQGAVWPVY